MASVINKLSQQLARFPRLRDFVSLARLDKPIGIYLLLWPTLTGLWFATEGQPGLHLFLVFTLGTVLTRSAGCIINDVADRDFDRQVKRTIGRPLATGRIEVAEALAFMGVLLFFALVLVLTTNILTLGLGILAALIAGIYPLMKRYTYLPQAVLGLAFSFGIPMAFAASQNTVTNLAWLLVVANVVWTVAYDTEYAMVDRDDDLKLGLRSTAILFGDLDRMMIGLLQGLFLLVMFLVVRLVDLLWPYFLGLAVAAGLFAYQQRLIAERGRDACFNAFLNNHWAGLAIFTGTVLHFVIVT